MLKGDLFCMLGEGFERPNEGAIVKCDHSLP